MELEGHFRTLYSMKDALVSHRDRIKIGQPVCCGTPKSFNSGTCFESSSPKYRQKTHKVKLDLENPSDTIQNVSGL